MGSRREGALEEALGTEVALTRIFLDANILFSASLDLASPMATLVLRSKEMELRCLCSPAILEEVVRNLKKKRPVGLKHLPKLLEAIEWVPSPAGQACPLPLPEKDRHVLLAAMAGNADVLLTGDTKDFGPFMNKPKQSAGVLIQTFAEFVARETR